MPRRAASSPAFYHQHRWAIRGIALFDSGGDAVGQIRKLLEFYSCGVLHDRLDILLPLSSSEQEGQQSDRKGDARVHGLASPKEGMSATKLHALVRRRSPFTAPWIWRARAACCGRVAAACANAWPARAGLQTLADRCRRGSAP